MAIIASNDCVAPSSRVSTDWFANCNFTFFREENLVVKVHDDDVIKEECKLGRIKNENGKSQVKVILAKRHEGFWEDHWCIE